MNYVVMVGANNPEVLRLLDKWENVLSNDVVLGFIDNNPEIMKRGYFGNYKVLGSFADMQAIKDMYNKDLDQLWFVNLVTGSTESRRQVWDEMVKWAPPLDFTFSGCDMDLPSWQMGIYIQQDVIIQANVSLGPDVAIHTGAIIAHEVSIGPHSFIAHGACISGRVKIGEGVFVGANATILPDLTIGDWATIGAGAVVIHDVPAGVTVVGNPAREIKREIKQSVRDNMTSSYT